MINIMVYYISKTIIKQNAQKSLCKLPIEIQTQICYNTSTTKARKPNKKGNQL